MNMSHIWIENSCHTLNEWNCQNNHKYCSRIWIWSITLMQQCESVFKDD